MRASRLRILWQFVQFVPFFVVCAVFDEPGVHAGLVHAILRKECKGKGRYSSVFQGRTYSFGSDASLARQHALRRSAPKRITRSDTVSRLMMESLRLDWPGEQPSSGIFTAGGTGAGGKAKKIPASRPTDVYWPWPLKRADLALPVWKQQRLFRLNREYEERRMEGLQGLGFTKTNWFDRQTYFAQLQISHV